MKLALILAPFVFVLVLPMALAQTVTIEVLSNVGAGGCKLDNNCGAVAEGSFQLPADANIVSGTLSVTGGEFVSCFVNGNGVGGPYCKNCCSNSISIGLSGSSLRTGTNSVSCVACGGSGDEYYGVRINSFLVTLLVDKDNDGVLDKNDNCPTTYNRGQEDFDGNGIGDACDEYDKSPSRCANSGWGWSGILPNACCGDDSSDCAALANTNLCVMGSGIQGIWYNATNNVGKVKTASCIGFDFVSNGNTWIECPSDSPLLPSAYTCAYSMTSTNNGLIGECDKHPYKVFCKMPAGTLACNVKTTCDAVETNVLELDNKIDGIAAIAGSNYKYKLCCRPTIGALSTGSGTKFAALSASTNAFVQDTSLTSYPFGIYLRSTEGTIDCQTRTFGTVGGSGKGYVGPKFPADRPNPYNINGHEYLCSHNIASLNINECCGDTLTGCFSSGDGVRKISGQGVEQGIGTYYCVSDKRWLLDIDAAGENTCVRGGFTWTGTHCCGDNRPNEYYNDNTGGCWNRQPVVNSYAPTGNNSIINYNGKFYGCNVADPALLAINDIYKNTQLVENRGTCDVKGNLVCTSAGQWVATSQAPYCAKFNFVGTAQGFCQDSTQCLLNIVGGNPNCINDTQFSGDGYCNDGEWTTRTRLIALRLLESATTNNYTVFCDKQDNTLNYVKYVTPKNIVVKDYLIGKVNNFCILTEGSKIAIGTSLNQPISAQPYSFIDILDIPSCSGPTLSDDGQYHPCDSSNKIWYNNKTMSIIYSNVPMTFGPVDFRQLFSKHLQGTINSFKSFIITNLHNRPYDYSIVDKTRRYDRLYFSVNGAKVSRGILEAPFGGKKYLAVNYTSYTTNACNYTAEYDIKEGNFTHISCGPGWAFAVSRDFVNENTVGEYYQADSIWNDLTSKLRVR